MGNDAPLRCWLSLGNYYVAYFRILNTLGIENLHEATVAELKKHLENERVRAAEELARAKAEYEAEQAEIREAERQLGTPAESPVEPAAWHKTGRTRRLAQKRQELNNETE